MPFLDKLNFVARTATEKANEAIGTGKIAVKIKKEEYNIEEQYKKIGAYYYAKRIAGVPLDPEVDEYCLSVDLSKATIAELQEQMQDMKSVQPGGAPEEERPTSSRRTCGNCGASVSDDALFCGTCGAKLEL